MTFVYALLITKEHIRSNAYKLFKALYSCTLAVLEVAAGHWLFSDQFQHLADQNPFWSAKFTVHFQWEGNQ